MAISLNSRSPGARSIRTRESSRLIEVDERLPTKYPTLYAAIVAPFGNRPVIAASYPRVPRRHPVVSGLVGADHRGGTVQDAAGELDRDLLLAQGRDAVHDEGELRRVGGRPHERDRWTGRHVPPRPPTGVRQHERVAVQ